MNQTSKELIQKVRDAADNWLANWPTGRRIRLLVLESNVQREMAEEELEIFLSHLDSKGFRIIAMSMPILTATKTVREFVVRWGGEEDQ